MATLAPAAAATTTTTTSTAQMTCSGEGDLFMAGGGLATYENGSRIYERVIDSVGGESEAKIAIVPAASGTPVQSGEGWKQDFVDAGVPESNIEVLPLATQDDPNTAYDESNWATNGDNQSVANTVNESNVIWFSGGAQNRIIDVLKKGTNNGEDTLVASAIRSQHECHGAAIGGSSAGTTMAGDDMPGAGDSYGAVRDGVSLTDTYGQSDDFRVWATQGMGFLDVGVIDTHFQQRGRVARLARLMVYENSAEDLERQTLGFGVGENTTLVFRGDTTTAEVYGENGVTIIDTSDTVVDRSVPGDDDAVNMTNIEVHYLTRYDSFDYGGSSLSFNIDTTGKTYDTDESPYYDGNSDQAAWIYNTASVKMMTEDLVDNTETKVVGTELGNGTDYYAGGDKGVKVVYTQDADTQGWWGDNYDDGVGRYAATNIRMDLYSYTAEKASNGKGKQE
ncbi:cyanophycinase [Haloferax elongans]|nr:cyanophycinase [Haloferax elongans]